jgi:hypothetical protein
MGSTALVFLPKPLHLARRQVHRPADARGSRKTLANLDLGRPSARSHKFDKVETFKEEWIPININ